MEPSPIGTPLSIARQAGWVRLLRWLSMPIGDLMSEWFDDERLRALLAGPGISGTMLGLPLGRQFPGPAVARGLSPARRWTIAARAWRTWRGHERPTWSTPRAKPAPRFRTNATVERVLVSNERVIGVVANGQEIALAGASYPGSIPDDVPVVIDLVC